MPTNKPFLGINIDAELLQRIDDFRFNNRISSRAKAVDKIIRAGMNALASEYPELDLSTKLETGKKAEHDGMNKKDELHF